MEKLKQKKRKLIRLFLEKFSQFQEKKWEYNSFEEKQGSLETLTGKYYERDLYGYKLKVISYDNHPESEFYAAFFYNEEGDSVLELTKSESKRLYKSLDKQIQSYLVKEQKKEIIEKEIKVLEDFLELELGTNLPKLPKSVLDKIKKRNK